MVLWIPSAPPLPHLRDPGSDTVRTVAAQRYDTIGRGYTTTRREDPELRALLHRALGDATSVANVGAGTGSYEPADRRVVPIEPSTVMVSQRPPDRAPAIRATAGALPLPDDAVDAAMAVLTVHHWDRDLAEGVAELRRVARGPVLVVTYDPTMSGDMWLTADYLPELAALDRAVFPSIDDLVDLLGGTVTVDAVATSRDTPDWTLGSFWAHPERVLDPAARQATSGFARMRPEVVERVVSEVERDLASGDWDRHHGHLRELDELDVGMRLVVANR